MKIDAHQHFWIYNRDEYGWIDKRMDVLKRNYLPGDLQPELPEAIFPEQRFILDHIAKPLIKDRIPTPWKKDLFRLAGCRNVWCKLSGMVTEADWIYNKPEDFHPYLDVVFEAFGPERLMIGSDWPVCRLSGEYREIMGIVEDYMTGMPEDVRGKITGGNCIDFYGLRV